MNKVLDLLEKYCQWLAIALGGLFLGLMVWWYLLFSPIAVQSGGRALTPATVDDEVHRNYTESLDREIHREQTELPPPQHVKAVEKWQAHLTGTDATVVALRADWPASIPQEVKLSLDNGPTTQKAQVAALPTVPPAETMELKAARAFVAPVVLPGQPAPPVPAAGQPPLGRDMSYVRLEFRIAPQEIARKFGEVSIPAMASNTSVEGISTYRQEQLPDGSWGPPVVVALLNNGVQIQPPPVNPADPLIVAPFRAWAESQQGQTDLLRPPFYTILQGEGPWDPPADAPPPPVDPAVELQKKRDAYKAKIEADKAKRQSTPRTPTGPEGFPEGPGGPGGPGGRPPIGRRPRGGEPYIAPLQWGQQRPPYTPGPYGQPPSGIRPPYGAPNMPPEGFDPGLQQPQAAPGSAQSGANPLPAPIFRPSDTQPFVGWAYDESVGEGKTYRYQVIYGIRNPVYQSNIVAKPEMAQTFLLWSKIEETAWSQPVLVKPSTEYFLAGPNWTSNTPNTVRIEVYKWSEGKWQSHIFTVAPGDEIGTVDGKTDFSTGATVVDIRYDVRLERAYLLVLAPDGKLVEHEPTADRASPRLAQLKQFVQQALNPNGVTDPNAFPPGGIPGGPPGFPGGQNSGPP